MEALFAMGQDQVRKGRKLWSNFVAGIEESWTRDLLPCNRQGQFPDPPRSLNSVGLLGTDPLLRSQWG